MVIGVCQILFYFPYVQNLKEKRSKLGYMKNLLRKRFNVSISEVEYQNMWQKSIIGIVMVSNRKDYIDKVFNNIIKELEKYDFGYVNNFNIEYEYLNSGEVY